MNNFLSLIGQSFAIPFRWLVLIFFFFGYQSYLNAQCGNKITVFNGVQSFSCTEVTVSSSGDAGTGLPCGTAGVIGYPGMMKVVSPFPFPPRLLVLSWNLMPLTAWNTTIRGTKNQALKSTAHHILFLMPGRPIANHCRQLLHPEVISWRLIAQLPVRMAVSQAVSK